MRRRLKFEDDNCSKIEKFVDGHDEKRDGASCELKACEEDDCQLSDFELRSANGHSGTFTGADAGGSVDVLISRQCVEIQRSVSVGLERVQAHVLAVLAENRAMRSMVPSGSAAVRRFSDSKFQQVESTQIGHAASFSENEIHVLEDRGCTTAWQSEGKLPDGAMFVRPKGSSPADSDGDTGSAGFHVAQSLPLEAASKLDEVAPFWSPPEPEPFEKTSSISNKKIAFKSMKSVSFHEEDEVVNIDAVGAGCDQAAVAAAPEPRKRAKISFDGVAPEENQGNNRMASVRQSQVHGSFELLDVWQKKRQSQYKKRLHRGKKTVGQIIDDEDDDDDEDEFDQSSSYIRRVCVFCSHVRCMSPNAGKRCFWDVLSCFFVFYDMVMTPMEFMEPGPTQFGAVMGWGMRIFWTFDIPMSFCTGFVAADGFVVRSVSRVTMRYLRSWFFFDFSLVAVEWLQLFLSEGGTLGFLRVGRTSRIVRIARMIRLLRLLRIRELVSAIAERIKSERLIISADILKVLMVVVGFAHIVACFWYGVGKEQNDDGTWIEDWLQEINATSMDFSTRYAASIHWSLSQFTGGMDEIRPSNTVERWFAIFSFVGGFLLASVLISSLTSSMTRLHMLSNTQSQQLVTLRRYLAESGISHRVTVRVQKNAQHVIMEQQRYMPEHKVELLALVSEPLRMEVHFEQYYHIFCAHPFLSRYMEECPHVMRKVCHVAATSVSYSPGDVCFTECEIDEKPQMLFVQSGDLGYVSMGDKQNMLKLGNWISEMSLWMLWMHRGTLVAQTNCRLCTIDAALFQNIAGQFEHDSVIDPRTYAAHFVKELNETEEEITDLTKVSFPTSMMRGRRESVKNDEMLRLATQTPLGKLWHSMKRVFTDGQGGTSEREKRALKRATTMSKGILS